MKRFATLLDALSYQPQRNAKLRLLTDYFAGTPDPDRGWALAALTGELEFAQAKPALIRDLIAGHVDPALFALSYDYVGDLAETVALLWSGKANGMNSTLSLDDVVTALRDGKKADLPAKLSAWLDRLDANGRWALLKLVTGGLRVGVSARLVKSALAGIGGKPAAEIDEVWHSLAPPYAALFAWLESRGERPSIERQATFRPVMLAHPVDEKDFAEMSAADFAAEWKWDGVRVQVVGEAGRVRLYTRSGDEITGAFPDVVEHLDSLDATLDGELLVRRDGAVAPFADLQKRLNRKTVGKALLQSSPAFVRLYDLLRQADTDLRGDPFMERRQRLENWHEKHRFDCFDVSPLIPFQNWDELAAQRVAVVDVGIEGVMLKRRDSLYVAGRPKGPWFKWKRDPMLVDAVLMYAQRGHGKRSSYYSDYTFGVWKAGELVAVGKAYFGFTDEELQQIDRWIQGHTINRFGPVREVEKGLVFEIAFEGLQRSSRHRSGIAMRFPRINRIRWDKPAAEADRIEALEKLLTA